MKIHQCYQKKVNQNLLPDAKSGQSDSRPRSLNGSVPAFEPSQINLPAFLVRLLQAYPFLQRHPHPFLVHFSIVFIYAAAFLSLLFLVIGTHRIRNFGFLLSGRWPALSAPGYAHRGTNPSDKLFPKTETTF